MHRGHVITKTVCKVCIACSAIQRVSCPEPHCLCCHHSESHREEPCSSGNENTERGRKGDMRVRVQRKEVPTVRIGLLTERVNEKHQTVESENKQVTPPWESLTLCVHRHVLEACMQQ